jgi:hypothetical protein
MGNQNISEADVNSNAVFFLTYSQLRTDLLTFGQPGFFNAANLPAATNINGFTTAYQLGQVGTDWRFVTLAGFFGNDITDMLLRNANTGGFE